MTPSPITSWQIDGETIETIKHFILLGFSITVDSDCSHVNKTLASWKKSYDKPNSILKKKRERERDSTLPIKLHLVKAIFFFSKHVWIWELDHKEGWAWKNWCLKLWCWRRLESPLDSEEIKPVNPEGNQSWVFIGRTVAEAETLILWSPNVKRLLIGKDSDGKGLRARGEGDNRGWLVWMASLTQCVL